MIKRVVIIVLAILFVAVAGGAAFLYVRKPAMAPPSAIRVDSSEASIARGKYLFEVTCDCNGCHSQRDFSRFGGPVVESGRGKGFVFPPEVGLPGTIVASNITSDRETGIGTWTDGEKLRAIRDGVSRDGRALFPLMPYEYYRHLSDSDVNALVAYLNTLPPISNPLPKSKVNFPVDLMIKGVPKPVRSVPAPNRQNRLELGAYLVTVGGCIECHTPSEKGRQDLSRRLAGGREFHFPGAVVVSANITPDADTGIGKWDERQFLNKFRQFKEYVEKGSPEVGPESFTLMPWLPYSSMADEELLAIYAYLKAQPAVRNAVEKRPELPKKTQG